MINRLSRDIDHLGQQAVTPSGAMIDLSLCSGTSSDLHTYTLTLTLISASIHTHTHTHVYSR